MSNRSIIFTTLHERKRLCCSHLLLLLARCVVNASSVCNIMHALYVCVCVYAPVRIAHAYITLDFTPHPRCAAAMCMCVMCKSCDCLPVQQAASLQPDSAPVLERVSFFAAASAAAVVIVGCMLGWLLVAVFFRIAVVAVLLCESCGTLCILIRF